MGINSLYDAYKKNPQSVEKLLASNIEISEQLNGSRFSLQYEGAGELSYFKRDSSPITKIDRTIARYYEKAILHFETLASETLEKLPQHWRFGFEYFPNLNPVKINYDRMPLNGLVLTDIVVKDPSGKMLEIIVDKKTLDEWAGVLIVEKPPILFEGKLSDSQRAKILDYLNTPFDDLSKRFKTENFTEFVLDMLTPQLKKTFMQNDKKKDIEGLVFRFNGKNPLKLAKPEDYINGKAKKEEKAPSDVYNLTLVIMQEFFQTLDFKKIRLKEKTFEDRYIEFISKVFNVFVASELYKKNFAGGIDFELPKYLSREEAKANLRFVTDPQTVANIDKSSTNRELFKIMLASMRSHKKKPSGVFAKELIQYHNTMVDKIADYVNVGIKESVLTFEQYKRIFLNEAEESDFGIGSKKEELNEDFTIELDDNKLNEVFFPTFDEMNKLRSYQKVASPLNVLRRSVKEDEVTTEKKGTPVCMIAGKFQPFNNGHLAMIKDVKNETGMKSFLVVKRKNLQGSISEELHTQILDEVVKAFPDHIAGYAFTEGRSLKEITQSLPESMKLGSYSGDEDECRDFSVQLRGSKISEGFKLMVASKYVTPAQVRERVVKEDMEGYRKLVPKVLWNFFYKIRNESK